MLPAQLGPPLHVKHASLPNSITKTKPGSSDPRTPLPSAQKGVRLQPAEEGEFSTGADIPGVVAFKGDQSDPAALQKVVASCPRFDLIVDDGSHIGSQIITSFGVLFPALRLGGWYVIEDFECAYMPDYGGGPPGTPDTAVALTKSLLDDVNVGPRAVASVHAYRGIAFIRKRGPLDAPP